MGPPCCLPADGVAAKTISLREAARLPSRAQRMAASRAACVGRAHWAHSVQTKAQKLRGVPLQVRRACGKSRNQAPTSWDGREERTKTTRRRRSGCVRNKRRRESPHRPADRRGGGRKKRRNGPLPSPPSLSGPSLRCRRRVGRGASARLQGRSAKADGGEGGRERKRGRRVVWLIKFTHHAQQDAANRPEGRGAARVKFNLPCDGPGPKQRPLCDDAARAPRSNEEDNVLLEVTAAALLGSVRMWPGGGSTTTPRHTIGGRPDRLVWGLLVM